MEALQTLSREHPAYREIYGEMPVTEDRLPKDGLPVSEKEYWEHYYDDPDFVYEWKNGYLEVRPVGDVKAGDSYRWFSYILECYVRENPVGRIITPDIGFRLVFPGGTSVRKPDLAVVLHSNPDTVGSDRCSYDGTYDLCVESLSYSSAKEIKRDTVDKKNEYEGTGVKEYYILDARGKETAFYRLNSRGRYVKIRPAGGIIRSGILPGFQFRISDLYAQPPLESLIENKVYERYILPSYRESKQEAEKRAEKEKLRAEKAEKRLILERQRAERLAAKLRELGISPE
jgi:Uma2 family endonuclease